MEEAFLRFAHLPEQMFKQLDNKSLVNLTLTDGEDDCESFRKNPNPPFFSDGWLNHDEIIGETPFWGHGGGHVAVGGAICPTAFFLL